MLGSRLLLDTNLRTEFLQVLETKLRDPVTFRQLLLPLVTETQVMNGEPATICLALLMMLTQAILSTSCNPLTKDIPT